MPHLCLLGLYCSFTNSDFLEFQEILTLSCIYVSWHSRKVKILVWVLQTQISSWVKPPSLQDGWYGQGDSLSEGIYICISNRFLHTILIRACNDLYGSNRIFLASTNSLTVFDASSSVSRSSENKSSQPPLICPTTLLITTHSQRWLCWQISSSHKMQFRFS